MSGKDRRKDRREEHLIHLVPNRIVVIPHKRAAGQPPICVHAETTCIFCHVWLYLGNQTYKAVMTGAAPVCIDCARAGIKDGAQPLRVLHDHLRGEQPSS